MCLIAFKKYSVLSIRNYFQNSELILLILMTMMLFKYETEQTQYSGSLQNLEGELILAK